MFALIYIDMGTCIYMFEQNKKRENFSKNVCRKYMENCEAIEEMFFR